LREATLASRRHPAFALNINEAPNPIAKYRFGSKDYAPRHCAPGVRLQVCGLRADHHRLERRGSVPETWVTVYTRETWVTLTVRRRKLGNDPDTGAL
jgi:hypothetical protein